MRTRRSKSSSDPVPTTHRSVLLHEVVEKLAVEAKDTVVDATLGGSGHAQELAKRLGPDGLFIGFDLDSDAISRAEATLRSPARVILINENFRYLRRELQKVGVETIDKAFFDLGWSADQLASQRGFSFQKDEQLLMTYAKELGVSLTARAIVNEWAEESIADVLHGWGEERYAQRIARAIVARRAKKPIATTGELVDVIKSAVPAGYARGRLHAATKTFQALRIAVNDELGALRMGLYDAFEMLAPGGRIAVITFHSIEDRIVKRFFQELEQKGVAVKVSKKPIEPTDSEKKDNPRARSAKLRVIEKILYDQTIDKDKQISTEHPAGDAPV